MERLDAWLTGMGIYHTPPASGYCFIFDPPPRSAEAHGAVVVPNSILGRLAAKNLRARGWVVRHTSNEADAMHWLQSLGYERVVTRIEERPTKTGRVVLQIPTQSRSTLNLVTIARAVIANPAVTTRALARELSVSEDRHVDREAVNRAMCAIGWGPEERKSFRKGLTKAPELPESGTPGA